MYEDIAVTLDAIDCERRAVAPFVCWCALDRLNTEMEVAEQTDNIRLFLDKTPEEQRLRIAPASVRGAQTPDVFDPNTTFVDRFLLSANWDRPAQRFMPMIMDIEHEGVPAGALIGVPFSNVEAMEQAGAAHRPQPIEYAEALCRN